MHIIVFYLTTPSGPTVEISDDDDSGRFDLCGTYKCRFYGIVFTETEMPHRLRYCKSRLKQMYTCLQDETTAFIPFGFSSFVSLTRFTFPKDK